MEIVIVLVLAVTGSLSVAAVISSIVDCIECNLDEQSVLKSGQVRP
jgi:hypothetical protein